MYYIQQVKDIKTRMGAYSPGAGPIGNGSLGMVNEASHAKSYVGFHSWTFLSPNISSYTYAGFVTVIPRHHCDLRYALQP